MNRNSDTCPTAGMHRPAVKTEKIVKLNSNTKQTNELNCATLHMQSYVSQSTHKLQDTSCKVPPYSNLKTWLAGPGRSPSNLPEWVGARNENFQTKI